MGQRLLIAKGPDHPDEGIDFGGIAVITRTEIPYRGLESRNEKFRVTQATGVDILCHDSSVLESARGSLSDMHVSFL